MSYVFAIVNFALFVFILWIVLRKPVRIFFSSRKEKVKTSMAAAERRRRAAEAKLQESEAHLVYFKDEAANLTDSMERHAEQEGRAVVGAAQEQAERMCLDARKKISWEIARMQQGLFIDAMQRAFDLAAKDIDQRIDKREAKRLVTTSIDLISRGL